MQYWKRSLDGNILLPTSHTIQIKYWLQIISAPRFPPRIIWFLLSLNTLTFYKSLSLSLEFKTGALGPVAPCITHETLIPASVSTQPWKCQQQYVGAAGSPHRNTRAYHPPARGSIGEIWLMVGKHDVGRTCGLQVLAHPPSLPMIRMWLVTTEPLSRRGEPSSLW